MDCFYTPTEYIQAGMLRIGGEEFHHLARVMRKAPGDQVLVTAGAGTMYRATLQNLAATEATCTIDEEIEEYNELPGELLLVHGLLKNPGKMDWVIEKATELGASLIFPVKTDRSIAKGGKVDRWNALALAAMKQSLRCRVPVVEGIVSMKSALKALHGFTILVCHEAAEQTVQIEDALQGRAKHYAVVIGPEGGLSDEELTMLSDSGASIVSLGPRRLRSETAAVTALARVSAYLENGR